MQLRKVLLAAVATMSVATMIGMIGVAPISGASAVQSNAASGLHIGGVVFDSADPYFVSLGCGAKAEAKKLGVALTWEGSPATTIASEAQTLDGVLLTNPQGLLVSVISPTAFVSTAKKLMAEGVPVVGDGSTMTPEVEYRTFYVDYVKAAESLAPLAGRLMGGGGTLGIIAASPGDSVDAIRYSAMLPVLKKEFPKISIVGPYYSNISTAAAASLAAGMILGNPTLKAIYATDGPEAAGVVSAVRAAHKVGVIKVFAFDATPAEVQALKEGVITALVSQGPYGAGVQGVDAIVSYLRAHPGSTAAVVQAKPVYTASPSALITKANVSSPSVARTFEYRAGC